LHNQVNGSPFGKLAEHVDGPWQDHPEGRWELLIPGHAPLSDLRHCGGEPTWGLKQMASWTGHFDRHVRAASRAAGIYPAGSQVRTEPAWPAVVARKRPRLMHAPGVRMRCSARSPAPQSTRLLDPAPHAISKKVLSLGPRERRNFPRLPTLSRLTA
jgi:hypothetical protein